MSYLNYPSGSTNGDWDDETPEQGKEEQGVARREAESASAASEKQLVRLLGNSVGYGKMMLLASQLWRERLEPVGGSGGEFVVGPCRAATVACGCQSGCDWCGGAGWLTHHVADVKKSYGGKLQSGMVPSGKETSDKELRTPALFGVDVWNPLEAGIRGVPLMVPAHEYNRVASNLADALALALQFVPLEGCDAEEIRRLERAATIAPGSSAEQAGDGEACGQ